MKWIAPILAYLAVIIGLFWFRDAWGALVGFHLSIMVSLFYAKPNIPVAVLFKSTKTRWILFSILLCGSSGVSLYFLWHRFGIALNISEQTMSLGLSPHNWLFFIAYFALVNPFIEEYFWRGYLGDATYNFTISDAIYAGYHALVLIGKAHLISIMFCIAVLTFAGWLLRQIAREDHGLLAPTLGHMSADFMILAAVYLRMQNY
ncbi:MAG TPA: CPBP family glutamic-type intramembrane protease [Anaerolineales bacterium]|jgi:membrane protease YdiL (CAAX protease family)|nr:CPBP family glutamic-type intramembrane protease [Anaerolineales bacterium]